MTAPAPSGAEHRLIGVALVLACLSLTGLVIAGVAAVGALGWGLLGMVSDAGGWGLLTGLIGLGIAVLALLAAVPQWIAWQWVSTHPAQRSTPTTATALALTAVPLPLGLWFALNQVTVPWTAAWIALIVVEVLLVAAVDDARTG